MKNINEVYSGTGELVVNLFTKDNHDVVSVTTCYNGSSLMDFGWEKHFEYPHVDNNEIQVLGRFALKYGETSGVEGTLEFSELPEFFDWMNLRYGVVHMTIGERENV